MTARTPLVAQQVMRSAIDRALGTPLTMREMKVFLALVQLIAFFDRTEDRVANRQVSDATGIDERHVRRALHSLHEKQIIERTPGKGRQPSLIDLDVEGAMRARAGAAPSGEDEVAPSEGADPDARGGRSGHVDGTPGEPASEVFSEVLSEVCVSDIARSKLNCGKRNDTHAQETELEVKVAALVAQHGEYVIREALEVIPAGSLPFAGDVIRTLRTVLPDATAAPKCERCNDKGQTNTGYPCGCPATYGRRAS